MKLIKPLLSAILLLSGWQLSAQSYFTGFDTPEEQAGWTQYRTGAISQFYEWEFDIASAYSAPNSLAHYYPVGGDDLLNDWMVSPGFDFSEGGTIDSVWHHFSGFSPTPIDDDTIAIYLLEGSPDPDQATSKTLLLLYNDIYNANSTWTESSNIAVPATPGTSYIAFRYQTVVSWLDVKFDNIKITPTSIAGLGPKNNPAGIEIYPNPSTGPVSIKINGNLDETIRIYNIQGQLIQNINASTGTVDLDLMAGTYFVKAGSMVKKIIVNQ